MCPKLISVNVLMVENQKHLPIDTNTVRINDYYY